MFHGRRVAAIIAAAGKGSRMGSDIPKQFLKLGGEPVMIKSIRTFENMDAVDYIFIVAGKDYLDHCRQLVEDYGFTKVESIVTGGDQRQDSVFNALQEMNRLKPGVEFVLIHDAARPFISEEVVENVLSETAGTGAAVACVAMKNSVRKIGDGGSEYVNRDDYVSVQTPQGFRKSLLINAYEKAYDDSFYGTDDASIVERAGETIAIVDGDYSNIKITTREDLPMENRVGTGFDVHRLTEGRKLVLGGVEIPWDRGLDGHSDADVVIHALMDALLGAAAMGDIGVHFPDDDPSYEGADSSLLLQEVVKKLDGEFYRVANVDITIMAQSPKLQPYIPEMRRVIAGCLEVSPERVSVKATTTERLGFVGREEGIACQAAASIYR